MQLLRIAARLPAPFVLSDHEPFKPLGDGRYGVSRIESPTPAVLARVKDLCQKAFAEEATVGFSQVDRVEAVFFDMDATVIAEESLVELAAHVGKAEHVAQVTERAMRGEIPFAKALHERVALLEGLPVATVREVAERLTPNPGIIDFCRFCRKSGVPVFMVSGGFVQMASIVAEKVGIEAFHANVLEEDGAGRLTGKVAGEVVDGVIKRSWMLATCERLGIAPKRVAAVGDGANDRLMLEAAGCAVGYRPKEVLRPHIHAQNAAGDHRFLGPLLFGQDLG